MAEAAPIFSGRLFLVPVKTILALLTVLLGTPLLFAQAIPVAPSGSDGLLGQRFAELGYSYLDFRGDLPPAIADSHVDLGHLSGNVPLAPGFDAGLNYGYAREETSGGSFRSDIYTHSLAASATLYTVTGTTKPFLNVAVGHAWSRISTRVAGFPGSTQHESSWYWSAGIGAEIALGQFAVTPRISYTDGFESQSSGSWRYGVELHHWFSRTIGGYADVTYSPGESDFAPEAWTYSVGLRYRF